MRDIKFRGKNKEGKWIYGTGVVKVIVNCKETNALEIIQSVDYDELDYYVPNYDSEEIRPDTIGQYTGLKDKNGKEIYEGDILELNKDGRIFYGTPDGLLAKKYQSVGFKDGAFMTCRNKHLIDDYDTYLWIISKYSTVAGNIYDNKNLLEEGE